MPSVTTSRLIAAPPGAVFSLFADIPGAPAIVKSIASVEMLTPSPVGIGTKWRETRLMMGSQATETLEMLAFSEPTSMAVGCVSMGIRYRTTFHFEPEGSGTRVTMVFDAAPQGLAARVLAGMMMGQMQKMLEADLDAMKAAAEAHAR